MPNFRTPSTTHASQPTNPSIQNIIQSETNQNYQSKVASNIQVMPKPKPLTRIESVTHIDNFRR